MDKETLNQRINALNSKIAKINKRLLKHQENQSEQAFVKEEAPWYSDNPKAVNTIDQLVQARWDNVDSKNKSVPLTIEDSRKSIQRAYDTYIANEKKEVEYAQQDLNTATATLTKYQSEIAKKDSFDKEEKIAIIWEFLQNWKKEVIEWTINNAKTFYQLKQNEEKAWQKYVQDKDLQTVDRTEQYYNHRKFIENYYMSIGSLTQDVYTHNGEIDIDKLNKRLDEDVQTKYDYFVKQITELAGEIVDASNLTISPKGEINGRVHGTLHDVDVWTTLSGGVVQCLHYRTYVHIAH
jgi:hypothetical protein